MIVAVEMNSNDLADLSSTTGSGSEDDSSVSSGSDDGATSAPSDESSSTASIGSESDAGGSDDADGTSPSKRFASSFGGSRADGAFPDDRGDDDDDDDGPEAARGFEGSGDGEDDPDVVPPEDVDPKEGETAADDSLGRRLWDAPTDRSVVSDPIDVAAGGATDGSSGTTTWESGAFPSAGDYWFSGGRDEARRGDSEEEDDAVGRRRPSSPGKLFLDADGIVESTAPLPGERGVPNRLAYSSNDPARSERVTAFHRDGKAAEEDDRSAANLEEKLSRIHAQLEERQRRLKVSEAKATDLKFRLGKGQKRWQREKTILQESLRRARLERDSALLTNEVLKGEISALRRTLDDAKRHGRTDSGGSLWSAPTSVGGKRSNADVGSLGDSIDGSEERCRRLEVRIVDLKGRLAAAKSQADSASFYIQQIREERDDLKNLLDLIQPRGGKSCAV